MNSTLEGAESGESEASINNDEGGKLFHGKGVLHWVLLLGSAIAIVFGSSAATLLGRLYFVDGGSRRLLYTWTESGAWPFLLLLLFICYNHQSIKPTPFTPKLIIIYTVMGILTALDNLLYSWGLSFLPISTNSLLCSSQLAFTAVFAFFIVNKRITAFALNSVFIITMSAVLLGVHADSDRPKGITQTQYNLGFVVTIAASALYALILTLTELIYRKVLGRASFVVVLEVQTWISAGASMFSLVGMWAAGDFSVLKHEAANFKHGPFMYSMVIVWCAVGWQLYCLGSAAIIFLTSSFLACVFTTAIFPVIPILGVIFFHESFSALKGLSMVMAIWGFMSYIYGGYLEPKKRVEVQNAIVP